MFCVLMHLHTIQLVQHGALERRQAVQYSAVRQRHTQLRRK